MTRPIKTHLQAQRCSYDAAMAFKYSIPEHWDIRGRINADSDPKAEFEIWQKWGKEIGFKGTEFTLEDFEAYIRELRNSQPPQSQSGI